MNRVPTFIALLLVTLIPNIVSATTVLQMDVEALTKTSDVIVVGKVIEQYASVVDGKVYTTTALAPQSTWKGQSSALRIDMRHMGGRTADLATRVNGMPNFEVGETVLVFLVKPKNYKFHIVNGLEQGKFSVVNGQAVQARPSMRLVRRDAKGTLENVPSLPAAPGSLEAMEARIDAILKAKDAQ